MNFQKTIDKIKTVQIQGAEHIAKAAAASLKDVAISSQAKTSEELLIHLQKASEKLLQTRPTEPCMANTLNFILSGLYDSEKIHVMKKLFEKIDTAISFFDKSQQKISEIGSQKIRKGFCVFTHCHSSTVVDILKAAKLQGKQFIVHNTETRPLYQGRITAKELAEAGIPVTFFVDSAGRYALKRADLMMIGADAITSEGKVINKIGSELLAEIAYKYEIPVYVCTNSWKFDVESIFGYEKNIEMRGPEEIWDNPPKGVSINNYAFEKVDSELISGIISEIGIFRPEVFAQEVKEHYPWFFNKKNKFMTH